MDAVAVVFAVIAPLGKHLPGERVPVAVEQCVFLCLRHRRKARQIAVVVLEQYLIVEYRARHKDAALLPMFFVPIWKAHDCILADGPHRRRCRDETFLDPSVPHTAGVRRAADVYARPRTVRSVAGKEVAVFLPCKVGQLVECDKVIRLPLILDLVLCVLHRAKEYFRPAWECPRVAAAVVARARIDTRVVVQRLVNELGKLREGLSQDDRLVIRDIYLTQCLDDQRIGFPPA